MSSAAGAASFGRVDSDGTVYVRQGAAERVVGQVPGMDPAEAMDIFTRRFEALELEVSLLERRVRAGALSPDDATNSIKTVRSAVSEAHAVGDLDGLLRRLDGLSGLVTEQRAARKAERARLQEEVRVRKEAFVAEAERLASSNDWRGGVNRFRELLEEWKGLPRLDRATDDELWHRFSAARTSYTRRRKAHFAQQAEQREAARVAKEGLVVEAEGLVGSTEWKETTSAYRDLMTRWKAIGPAPKDVDEELWKRFRAAQDAFFAAKQAVFSDQHAELEANAKAKEALLAEGEALLPVRNVRAAKAAYRDLLNRWSSIGRVPRESSRSLEGRLHAIESAIRTAEEDRWRRNNPEARARAEDTAAKLQAQIRTLEEQASRAEERGDERTARHALQSAATYRQWLEQARRTLSEFGGSP